MTKKVRKKYTPEFRAEAVSLVRDKGYSVTQAAESLGVSSGLLHRWKSLAEKEQAVSTVSEDEKAELMRLRRENKELRMEKEILKKASAFFAKEMK